MKNGSYINTSCFLFRYIPNETPQYAFVAPKNIAKKANTRNSLRRKGYNILKKYNLKPIAGIFFYKKGSNSAENTTLSSEIEQILSKTKIYE